MATKTSFSIRGRNPDVLTCIANLSNDEVFTPPEFANQMLDTLQKSWATSNGGENIWTNPNVRFLDPFTKSGVFLREIVSRLTDGLVDAIPDLQKRVDHIATKQVFGVGVTELTSLLARRSVYCSKFANGDHSITTAFQNQKGNIWYERTEHTWVGGTKGLLTMGSDGSEKNQMIGAKCKYCGAPQKVFGRDDSLETHAYAFIHTADIHSTLTEIFGEDMQFDVVIGNPPYQMTDAAGGGVDASIYHLFVNMAKQLEPRFLTMVIPSRWMGGATRGVGDFTGFRERMFSDQHLRHLVDFTDSKDVFPGVTITGGVCYFLWEPAYKGPTTVETFREGIRTEAMRELGEFDVFVRDSVAVKILRKILKAGEPPITEILTADTPFGIASNFSDHHSEPKVGDVALYFSRQGKRSVAYMERSRITKNVDLIDKWKLLTPSGYDGGQKIPFIVLGKPWKAGPNSVSTQTFLAFHLNSEAEIENLESYYRTKFFRFLVSLRKLTQNGFRSTYGFVPLQEFNKEWTDELLFDKYALTMEERKYINTLIRPMEAEAE
jgi:site-specific DNA-methyltransferase (adenine-specific)